MVTDDGSGTVWRVAFVGTGAAQLRIFATGHDEPGIDARNWDTSAMDSSIGDDETELPRCSRATSAVGS